MNKHDIAKLACKLLGLYTVVNSMGGTLNFLASLPMLKLDTTNTLSNMWPSYLQFVVWAMVGLILWFQADSFANAMGFDNEIEDAPLTVSALEIQTIAFSVIGLVFLATSIPKAATLIGQYYMVQQNFSGSLLRVDKIAEVVVQFVVGLSLFLGSQGLTGLLKSLRYSGGKNEL
jgi:hypothetical protein